MEKAKLLVDARAEHGESPYWCSKSELLYWLDIFGQKIHMYNPVERRDTPKKLPILATTLIEKQDGGFLVSGIDGIYSFDSNFVQISKNLSLENENIHTTFNKFVER